LEVQYSNATSQNTLIPPIDAPRELIFSTIPGTRWEAKLRTQTVEPEADPNEPKQQSKWSNRATLQTMSLPNDLFVKVDPLGPDKAEVTWALPEGYPDWSYGVDLSYQLLKLGGCKPSQLTKEQQEPVVLENVHDKKVLLENLVRAGVIGLFIVTRL